MLLSDRQRLVAEAGLLTLLAWMAVTIAFNTTPRQSSAGLHPEMRSDASPTADTDRESDELHDASIADAQDSPLTDAESLQGAANEPKVTLPRSPQPLTTGTVIRMGEGVHIHPEPEAPQPCLTRSATGAASHGPVP